MNTKIWLVISLILALSMSGGMAHAADDEADGQRDEGEQREFADEHGGNFALGEANDAQGGEVAAAFRKGDARAVIDDPKGDHDGEAEVEPLHEPDHVGGAFAKARAHRALDAERGHARRFFHRLEKGRPVALIHGEIRAAHGGAFAHEAAERFHIHVGGEAGVVGDEPLDGRLAGRAAAFLDFEDDAVSGFRAEDFREFRREEQAIGWERERLAVGVEHHKTFLRKMGQLDRLRTELPESAEPLVPKRWGELNTVTIAFGHGLSVAPLQAVRSRASKKPTTPCEI